MTTKQRLHELVDELSEPEAKRALRLVQKEHEDPMIVDEPEDAEPGNDEDEAAKPGDSIDDWGNLSAMTDAAAGDLMDRLAEEETAAGLEPW